MYEIIIHKRAKKKLLSAPKRIRGLIVEAIHKLGLDPDRVDLDIKKLQGQDGYRLRIGSWRVVFERDDLIRVLFIEKIGPRGDVYK